MSRFSSGMILSLVLLVSGSLASSAQAALVKPASLVASVSAKSGSLVKSGDSYRLTLNLTGRKTTVRSVSKAGLLGGTPIAFKQGSRGYLSTWRETFEGDRRSAIVSVVAGGERLSLSLERPRFIRGGSAVVLSARKKARPGAPFERYRGRPVNQLVGGFGPAVLRLSDNGWTKISAHMNAYGSSGGCSGGSSDSVFSCHSTAEGGGTEPFRGVSWFGSTGGGRNVYATGNGVLTAWNTGDLFAVNGKLVGTMDSWASDAFTVSDKSTYSIDGFKCDKHPSSGTARMLTGKPGGPLHMDLNSAGDVFIGTGYSLDIQGYLSESFFAQAKCGS